MEKRVAIDILNKVLEDLKMIPADLARELGMKRAQGLYDILNPEKGNVGISKNLADKINRAFPQFKRSWLLTGEVANKFDNYRSDSNLIPFYDDVTSIGGNIDQIAEVNGVSEPAEQINAGDWFRDATAAIRHYGQSMEDYPSGCILAIKEVQNRDLIVWGKDYVIETSEYRITKRVQKGKDDNHIKAYSTNKETYPDGKLVHEPIDIRRDSIRRLFIVLGYVVKKNGGTMFFSNKNSK
jgi:hypothetical protein